MKSAIIAGFVLCAGLTHASEVSGTVFRMNGRSAGQAVVVLRGAARCQPLRNAVVDQRHHEFIPHVSVVTVGTTVSFPNNDTVFHNVFTEYHSTRFDLGMYARGSTKTQTFDRPGLAVLLCSVHPDMSAYVMVVDSPYYAIADRNGHYTIKGVPPGTYRVQAWHESGERIEFDLTVGTDASTDAHLKR